MKNVFQATTTEELKNRISKLTPETKPLWGKMNAAQMLAHCNITYELVYEDKHPKPSGIKKLLMKLLIKPLVLGAKPFKKNGQTAPHFLVKEDKNFATEKQRLVDHVQKTQQLGGSYFEGKESHSFGPLKESEWNTMFYKHLDHHLTQFGV